mmetsp:Transcript_8429/g.26003  ORF Transcript_8429/g.26003 Transcript_8429/m.26003 type:complete len:278 (-) Transcript_8429:245-1078(-)
MRERRAKTTARVVVAASDDSGGKRPLAIPKSKTATSSWKPPRATASTTKPNASRNGAPREDFLCAATAASTARPQATRTPTFAALRTTSRQRSTTNSSRAARSHARANDSPAHRSSARRLVRSTRASRTFLLSCSRLLRRASKRSSDEPRGGGKGSPRRLCRCVFSGSARAPSASRPQTGTTAARASRGDATWLTTPPRAGPSTRPRTECVFDDAPPNSSWPRTSGTTPRPEKHAPAAIRTAERTEFSPNAGSRGAASVAARRPTPRQPATRPTALH